ncbi:hypothetical protein GETHLI_07410 [Geothrix limicola]|uniref:Response regulatory domain-containing protein n=1 Tax=Geothrix limicola TaxID=2927978 RepID=A0ABQ5QDX3_9BACT|nr:hypothetical protein [Geothrix limicola]GLH72239.1 hypothetical protein GETHLI_07410 [Geothrix limicola]
MAVADLIAALLLPLPPWLGFWIFRRKGRIGLSYGYFLGGILTMLALPWAHLAGSPVPTAQLGGALFGFTLFLQAQREGVQGVRRLALGVGGATGFLLLLLLRLHLPAREVAHFWVGAALEGLLWLLCSDLAYRWAKGRQLEVRMPLVGAAALGLGALAQRFLPAGAPRVSWSAALLAGILLGLVALQQLRWLRSQGAWVEGRGEGLRVALAILDQKTLGTPPALALGLEARQPMWLVDAQGRILESNGPFSQLAGLPRHRLRGYALDAIFQGGVTAVWEDLRSQLLQYGCGATQATQVSEDGTFRQMGLEAAAFDRGMALVWMRDPAAGSLSLSGAGALEAGGAEEGRRQRTNALLALSAAIERFRSELPQGPLHAVVDQIGAAAARLDPSPDPQTPRPHLDGKEALTMVLPWLQTILPVGGSLQLEAEALPLAMDPDALRRIATHLALHALEHAPEGRLTLILESVLLGSRTFGLLHVRAQAGRTRPVATIFGLGWLRQSVLEVGGLLELDQDLHGGLRPRVYLPTASRLETPAAQALAGRQVWVVDQDPLACEALTTLIELGGGQARSFEDLRGLLRDSREQAQPDVLVLERTPRLERFHRSLRAFQKEPIPTLVLGMGHPLPINPSALGLRRLGFLEKPFRAEAFLEALLALLHQPDGTGHGLL